MFKNDSYATGQLLSLTPADPPSCPQRRKPSTMGISCSALPQNNGHCLTPGRSPSAPRENRKITLVSFRLGAESIVRREGERRAG